MTCSIFGILPRFPLFCRRFVFQVWPVISPTSLRHLWILRCSGISFAHLRMLRKSFITVIACRARNNDLQVAILFHGVVEYFTQTNACDLNKTHGAGTFMAWVFSFILMCCDCCCFRRLCKNNLNIKSNHITSSSQIYDSILTKFNKKCISWQYLGHVRI